MGRKVAHPSELFGQLESGWPDLKVIRYRGSLPQELENQFVRYVDEGIEFLIERLAVLNPSKRFSSTAFFFHAEESIIGVYVARPSIGRYRGHHTYEFGLGIVDITTKDNKGKGYIALPAIKAV